MENKKFKSIRDQYVDFQRQNAMNALKNAIYNYFWIVGEYATNPDDFYLTVSGIVDEFYKTVE